MPGSLYPSYGRSEESFEWCILFASRSSPEGLIFDTGPLDLVGVISMGVGIGVHPNWFVGLDPRRPPPTLKIVPTPLIISSWHWYLIVSAHSSRGASAPAAPSKGVALRVDFKNSGLEFGPNFCEILTSSACRWHFQWSWSFSKCFNGLAKNSNSPTA